MADLLDKFFDSLTEGPEPFRFNVMKKRFGDFIGFEPDCFGKSGFDSQMDL